MDPRQRRGLRIAKRERWPIMPEGDNEWVVRSETAPTKRIYTVRLGRKPSCNCEDFDKTGDTCKHIWAVRFHLAEQQGKELPPVPPRARPTYPQNWPAYNAAQVNEKDKFQVLLHDLCSGLNPPRQIMGRPRTPLADIVFSVVLKVYSGFSTRRFMSDLRSAHRQGHISKLPHYNSVLSFFGDPNLTETLMGLITLSCLPLSTLETRFAVDGTGISTRRFRRWQDERTLVDKEHRDWIHLNLICGVRTHVVAGVALAERNTGEAPFLPLLVAGAAKTFRVLEVFADSNFSSVDNLKAVDEIGAVPYIEFDAAATGEYDKGAAIWKRMYLFYKYRREEFDRHFGLRENVEAAFYMIKEKFGDRVRSKDRVAMKNEVLCKVLCHNICCVIMSHYAFGIAPTFWPDDEAGDT